MPVLSGYFRAEHPPSPFPPTDKFPSIVLLFDAQISLFPFFFVGS